MPFVENNLKIIVDIFSSRSAYSELYEFQNYYGVHSMILYTVINYY